ncbi:MAG: SCP2 sterol-binding domain-containing protein [Acidimicrobiales bacterium]
MARFLSPEWLAALGEAAAASAALRERSAGVHLTVGHTVRGGPSGDVSWTVALRDGSVSVTPAGAGADVEVVEDYETAAAVYRGDVSPAAAFAAGRIRLGGRVALLARHADLVAGLGDVFAAARAATEY